MDVKKEHETILKNLADTMLGIARESVSMVKRSDQEVSTKLSREQEWEIYLEFLKVMFNLADRVSAFYIPLQQQPQFMDGLEDYVSDRLITLLAPTMSSSEIDDQELMLSMGQAVAESRQIYEKYKFVYSEDTKARNAFFQHAAACTTFSAFVYNGNVEKSRQRRSRPFAVLTYMSTLRASKGLRPCWTDFFEHSLPLTMLGSSGAYIGN